MGQIPNKQMHRLETDSHRSGKASFKFAWAMDETDDERGRGITIDIAKREFETSTKQITILDAPGHVDFIPAVISGAAQADAAILVVDATRGEFETGFSSGGQTREHTYLARSLGVKSLIVAINKMDTVDWSWIRFNDLREQLKPFLRQASFNLNDVQFVACSGMDGAHLTENHFEKVKRESSHPQLEGGGGDWHTVPTLIEALDKISQPERLVDKPTRVIVTDVYKGVSSGVFIGAKVVAGKLEVKQKLLLLPPNEFAEIKAVELDNTDLNKSSSDNRAFAGDIVAATTIGIDLKIFYRGCVLSDPQMPCQVAKRFQARIIMFQGANTILFEGTPLEVHINGNHESGRVSKLMSLLNKTTGELIQRRPRCITRNTSAVIRITLERVVCCELYEDNKDLGRFMIRCSGKTIAAGLITKIKPKRSGTDKRSARKKRLK